MFSTEHCVSFLVPAFVAKSFFPQFSFSEFIVRNLEIIPGVFFLSKIFLK